MKEETAIASSARRSRRGRAVVDRDREQLVALLQLARQLGHHLLGHALVRLVLEIEDVAVARAVADGAEEARDRAGLVALHFAHDGVERERLGREPEVAAETGGISATSSPSASTVPASA